MVTGVGLGAGEETVFSHLRSYQGPGRTLETSSRPATKRDRESDLAQNERPACPQQQPGTEVTVSTIYSHAGQQTVRVRTHVCLETEYLRVRQHTLQ